MNIRFRTSEIIPTLLQVNAVVPQKTTIPILSNILVVTRDDGNGKTEAIWQTSDSEVWMQMKTPLLSGDGGRKFCINSNDFLKAVRNLKDEEVSMEFDSESKIVTCYYGKGQFSLPYGDGDEFPMPITSYENSSSMIISSKSFLKAIDKTLFAVGNDTLRIIINGIHFDANGDTITAASLDGVKLARYKTACIKHADSEQFSFTLSTKLCCLVRNLLATMDDTPVKISFENNSAVFSCQYFRVTSRLIEGRYPPYEKAIPSEIGMTVKIDKDELIEAVKRVLPLSSLASELVKFSFSKDKLVVSAQDISFSKAAKEEISCEYDGEEIVIGFKGSALQQTLANLDGDCAAIELVSPQKSAVFYDVDKDTFLSVLAPLLTA